MPRPGLKKVLFLDFDGVVNTPMWAKQPNGAYRVTYNRPIADGVVNNEQAVRWVDEFCREFGFDIILTTVWQDHCDAAKALYDAGLSSNIRVFTEPTLSHNRTETLPAWLSHHHALTNYVIVDDCERQYPDKIRLHFVKTDPTAGFVQSTFEDCRRIALYYGK